MASQAKKGLKKKIVKAVVQGYEMRTHVPAGMATAAPPLGSMLGQVS